MALAYIDLGIPGEIQLLVLSSGVPYGIQNAQGLTQFGASSFSSISGTANQVAASAGPAVTLSIPAVFIAPGSVAATTTVHAGTSVSAVTSVTGDTVVGTTSVTGDTVVGTTSVTGATVTATTMLNAPVYAKASLPAVGTGGGVIFVSDATGAHVTGSLAFSNGTSWIDVTTGVAVV